MKTIFALSLLMIFLTTSFAVAVDVAPRISDREIIESLAELKAGQKSLDQKISDMKESTNQRFDDMNKRFDDRFDDMNKRFGDMNQRFDDMNKRFDTLQWMLGFFITVALAMLGFIMKMLWEQQRRMTAVEITLETQKDEIAFFKSLVQRLLPEKLVPPKAVG
jgi:hypothetical protein